MKRESFERPWFLREASPGNRGEAQEIFLAIGIYLAFKNKKLDKKQIYDFLMQNAKGTSVSAGPVKNNKGDTFSLNFPIPTSLQAFLKNPKNYSTISPNPNAIYAGMLQQVTQVIKSEFKDQVNFIHNNKRKDRVNIAVVGATGGKIDVQGTVTYMKGKEEITEPLENMQISLKVGSKSFDQLSKQGPNMIKSFSDVLGFNVASIAKSTGLLKALEEAEQFRQQINSSAKIKQLGSTRHQKVLQQMQKILYGGKKDGPLDKFYKQLATTLSKKLKGKGEEEYERAVVGNALGSMIENGVTKRQGKLSMLKFDKKGYNILDYTAIRKLTTDMAQTDLKVDYENMDGRPRLVFKDLDNNTYFQIRNFIQEKGTVRNYVESGSKFSEYSRFVPYEK